jgi:peptidoglycan/xylan/chitin deacetylase (PgdA/CDA1 family)
VNRTLKHLAERTLTATGVARLARQRLRGRTLVLAYHNIVPDDGVVAGDRSLHLPRREFARQLDRLQNSFDVVPLGALWELGRSSGVARSGSRARGRRPRIAITFDDAYAGAVNAGVEELVKRKMPATIFVAPALLGIVPWWDILAEQHGGVMPDELREHALRELGGRTDAILKERKATREGNWGVGLAKIASEAELSRAAARPGISLGSHTWSHQNLTCLSGATLDTELSRPMEWLRSRFPSVVSWVSYPYGLFSDAVESAARGCGYDGAFRIEGGWVRRSIASPYAVPRLNVPSGLSIDGFRLRLSGL